MKKFTSLLMAVAAWLFATAAVADESTSETTSTFTVATTPTTYENITTGYYVVKAKAKGNAGLVYHTGSGSGSFRINKSITDVSTATDSSYVWYITQTKNGLVFQNAKDGAYLPATTTHGGNCNIDATLANAAVLQTSTWDSSYTGALESGFTLKQMNNNPYSSPLCLHANDYSSGYALNYWEGGTPGDGNSLVMFAAYSITSNFTSAHISKALAVKETITKTIEGTQTEEVIYKALADSSTFSVPDVELSYYYTETKSTTPENLTVSENNSTFTYTQTITCGDMPFEISTAANPVWYTVKFRNANNRYLVHQATSDNNIGAQKTFNDITDWTQFKGALWAFVKSDYGVKVLCKQTGTYINVASGNNTTKATLNATGTTFIVKTNTSNSSAGFSLKVPNVNNAYMGEHKDGVLAVWNNGSAQNDGGSSWTIAKAETSEDIKSLAKKCITSIGSVEADETYLSARNKKNVTAANAIMDSATTFNALLDSLDKAYILYYTPIPEEGAYYRIVNCNGITKKYISSENISVGNDGTLATAWNADNTINCTISRVTASDAYLPTIWKLEKQSDGNYLIRNANNGANICDNSGSDMNMPINTAAGGHFALQAVPTSVLSSSDAKTMFQLKLGSNLINAFGGDNNTVIRQWNDATDKGSYWKFEKVTAVPVAISSANYATVCYPFAVQVADTSGVKAYYTQQVEDGTMTLVEITDGIIPANTGVILYHDGATTTTLALTTTEKTLSGNKLDGVTARRTGYTSLETYVLALNSENKAAFCQSELTVIPANKAYLKASNIGSTNVGTQSINFGFNKVDGISLTPSAEQQHTKYYDLNGRAVPYPVHGIFVTDKGKKVLIP